MTTKNSVETRSRLSLPSALSQMDTKQRDLQTTFLTGGNFLLKPFHNWCPFHPRKKHLCRPCSRPRQTKHIVDGPRLFYKATVCFFFVSRYMDEKNQWGSEIKKTKNFKKKTLSAAVTASPASSTLRRQRFLDVLTINHQANVALFGTSRSMLHQSRANLPRRMWSCFFHFPTFLGKSLSSCHLRQGIGPARLQFLHATKRQRKNENHPVRDESCAISNARLRKTLHFVFFSRVFFF